MHLILGAFSLYDIDRDGHISREEMVKIISAIYEMVGDSGGVTAESKANQIFDHMDFVSNNCTCSICLCTNRKHWKWEKTTLQAEPHKKEPLRPTDVLYLYIDGELNYPLENS